MQWLNTAIILERKQFQRLTCNHAEINFYYKNEDDNVHIITLVDATKRYYYELSALTDLRDELERKFLLRGAKNVYNLFIIYTGNIPFYKQALSSDLKIWLVDINTNRLQIYENQPDDFLGLKIDIENSLKAETPKKKLQYPFMTLGLLALNVIVFLFMYVFSLDPNKYIELGANCWANVFLDNEYYRLFTCMFIHSGSSHLINNMFSLAIVGNETEQKLGHRHFIVLYMVSGLLSSLASAYYNMNMSEYTNTLVFSIGASGAIFGIYGAYMVITLLSNKMHRHSIPVSRIILVTFLLLFSGFTGENVDNVAHLSGLIVGIIISFIYCKCDKSILKY